MDRILFCVARGRPEFGEMALGLARSLDLINDQTPRVIMTDLEGVDWGRYFQKVIKPTGPRSALDKLTALEHTDADAVLSLDVDMLAFKRLDDIFQYCEGNSFAVQGFWDDANRFHGRDTAEVIQAYGLNGKFPRFNGGMAYYERGEAYEKLLASMRDAEQNYGDLGFETFRHGYASEEVCMLHAMLTQDRSEPWPFELIPMEKQFQHSLAGLIGPMTLDVLRNQCFATCKGWHLEFAQPYIFHAWRYKDFTIYWNQLKALRNAELKADQRPREYIPRLKRIRRSFERRWMKYVRRWR